MREILVGPAAISGFLIGEGVRSTSMDSTLPEANASGARSRCPLSSAGGVEAGIFPVLKVVCCADLVLCSCSICSADFWRDSSSLEIFSL